MRWVTGARVSLPLVLAGIIAWMSFAGEGAAYRFPQLLAVLLVMTAALSWLVDLRGWRDAAPLSLSALKEFAPLMPGLVYFVLYITLAQTLGFYLSSGLAMGAMLVHYAWRQGSAGGREWLWHGGFLAGFLLLMYALFNGLLRVQAPRGWLF